MTGPAPEVRRAFLLAALRLTALFALVFCGTERLAAAHAWRVPVHMAWELAIPYWPAAYPLYFSVLALPFVVPFLARDGRAVAHWERQMAIAVGVAGVCFVLLPAEPAYAAQEAGPWAGWAAAARTLAGRHNLLPSLHVALSLLTLLHVAPAARPALRALLALWFALLVASVLLTHQHHVADVLAGAALGLALRPARGGRPSARP